MKLIIVIVVGIGLHLRSDYFLMLLYQFYIKISKLYIEKEIFMPLGPMEGILHAILYYEECQAGLGNRFRVAIESVTKQISNSPFVYRILQASFRCYLIPKFPYYLIYSINPGLL
ncbi:MAG: hypothetical protein CSA25_04635 [Desulfobacter postgatei]|uniref:Uncharacterized protein n=1 Tax=Desulfobacter postgatei TaxID=2293 RepID=A0A2G6MRB3_9BACT|nr:MAG: hypothetical protein CSA25_04635 [Desulfobacter postgatei]